MPLSLYQKYRPKRFEDIVGQEHVVNILEAEIKSGNISHAYIFIGPRGTGKTTTARIFANSVNCLSPDKHANPCGKCDVCKAVNSGRFLDLIEIDAASNRGVDNIRELREKVNMAPVMGKYKVYIIDEVHMLTKEAFNALLKTLEEPPEHVIFILATTEPHKVPATIMSRCERFVFYLADQKKLLELLDKIAKQENIEIEDKAKHLLIRQANGSYRDLLSVLDPVFSAARQNNNKVTEELVLSMIGLFDNTLVQTFLNALFSLDFSKAQKALEAVLNRAGNIPAFIQVLIDTIRQDLANYHKTREFPKYYNNISYSDVVKFLSYLIEEYTQIRFLYTESLALELAVFRFLADHNLRGSATVNEVYATDYEPQVQALEAEKALSDNSDIYFNQQQAEEEQKMQSTQDFSETIEGTSAILGNINESDGDTDGNTKLDKTGNSANSKISVNNSNNTSLSEPNQKDTDSNASASLTIDEIKKRWQLFLARVRSKHGPLYAILILSVPDTVIVNENGVHELRIFVPYAYHKQKIEDAKTRKLLQKIFKNIYGTVVNVVAIVSKDIKQKKQEFLQQLKQSVAIANHASQNSDTTATDLSTNSNAKINSSNNTTNNGKSKVDTSIEIKTMQEAADITDDPVSDVFADDLLL